MKFADLVFDQQGCCGSHNWARVVHASGIVTEVTDEGDGTYTAATRAGNVLLKPPTLCNTPADVDARLAADALLSE